MNGLPDYFLADLPPGATLSAAMIEEACRTLKRNREQHLAGRTTEGLVRLLGDVAESWLEPGSSFRKLALEHGPAQTGFSAPVMKRGLEAFFKQLTAENLNQLIEQDLGHARRLDAMVSGAAEQKSPRGAMVCGPEFLVHITAGNIPNPALMSMVLGVLTRSAQFVKCARGASLLPRLFAHSLYEADHKLGACLEVAEWRGGTEPLENALFNEADCVSATGTDETLATLRRRLPARVRLMGYGHRVSFAVVTRDAAAGFRMKTIVAAAADDIVAWDQLGCLSPHVVYVEQGADVSAEHFAEHLAAELARREHAEPRGKVTTEIAATIASRRSFYEVRAAHTPLETRLWQSANSTAWTVVYESDPRFQASCGHRFIYVKGVTDLTQLLQGADAVRGRTSTVGVAASEERRATIAADLARWGATRVCPLGRMQQPPLAWRHDGRPALGDLVVWTDFEK